MPNRQPALVLFAPYMSVPNQIYSTNLLPWIGSFGCYRLYKNYITLLHLTVLLRGVRSKAWWLGQAMRLVLELWQKKYLTTMDEDCTK